MDDSHCHLARARHWREYGTLQRRQRTAAEADAGERQEAWLVLCRRPQRHGHQRKWVQDRCRLRRARRFPIRCSSSSPPTTGKLSELFPARPWAGLGTRRGRAEIATSFISTGNYYAVLGVKPTLGRLLTPKDDRPSAAPVALISHRYWVSRFGGDPRVVGKTVTIGPLAVTIVGVISPEFTGIQQPIAEPPDVSLPLALQPQLASHRGWTSRRIGGTRFSAVRNGVTPEQVRANLDTIFQRTARDGMTSYLACSARRTGRRLQRQSVPTCRVSWSSPPHTACTIRAQTSTGWSRFLASWSFSCCSGVRERRKSAALARGGRRREIAVRCRSVRRGGGWCGNCSRKACSSPASADCSD